MTRKESELLDIINQLKGEITEIKGVINYSHKFSPPHHRVGNGAAVIVGTTIEDSSVVIASNVDKVSICPGDAGPEASPQTGQST